ncbi:oxidoreductase [Afipia sp. P52-10]|jgi:uncharacterized protein (DUF934 family)|uniref:DUF934 domain-containing protein n=1 Tax=Afipia sp. P52-10 TaxID=1429916 RepID=UPI0003DF3515|nr:DUF934 domain-containing protein [Afipia sp. P52-10]ETR77419.1 oxidoreductase [Afipia sp. P52-10]
MPLVKGGEVVADRYIRILDDTPVPVDGPVLVPAARFLADADELTARNAETGVIWPNSRDIDELAPYLDKLTVVALEFPNFKDGRAYSQARILREQYRYQRELRATGQVLRDQFVFMLRAGFDSLEVKKDSDAEAFATVIKRYSVFYQPTGDGRITAFRKRLLNHQLITASSN